MDNGSSASWGVETSSEQDELRGTALEQAPVAIAITSLAGYLLYANQSFLKLCELGQEAVAAHSDIREASGRRINSPMFEAVAREGCKQQFLVAWPVANDESREFLCSISRAQENSTPAYLTFVLQDCSVPAAEYRRRLAGTLDLGPGIDVTAEDRGKLQHDRAWMLQELLEAADTPIYMVDRKLRFLCFNSMYSRMIAAMGLPPVTIGESVLDTLADPVRRRNLGTVLGRVFNGERVIEAAPTPDVVTGALRHWFDFSFTPARRADGRIDAVVASGRDISAAKLLDHRREQFNKELLCRVERRTSELRAANQELNTLVLGVSDHLQSPLRLLDTLLERAGGEIPQSGAVDAYLRKAGAATSRMRRLVEDLLRLSRVGMRTQQLEAVDPNRLVREVLRDLTSLTAGREIEMEIEHLPAIESDPVLLRQILQDLLNNAITFTRHRKPARIRIRTAQSDAGMVWSVIDNGVGFEMQDATRIFVPFVQLHRQFRRHGTGIGLVIVKRALHELGGRVWAESAPDRGASFHFVLGSKAAQRHGEPG